MPIGASEPMAAPTMASPMTRLPHSLHLEIVPCASSDQRNLRPAHAVGATHDLLLVAGQSVGEEHQHAMRHVADVLEARGDLGTRLAEARGNVHGRASADRETGTSYRGD